jgi:uncharacterized protein (TIGR03083 family)
VTSTRELLRQERLDLVARLRGLTDEQWRTPSLCAGWDVHHVVAHLCTAMSVSIPALALRLARNGGRVGRTMDGIARELAARPSSALLDLLEARADTAVHPPGLPLEAPFTDCVVHVVDVRWPLGDPVVDHGDPERVARCLDFLTGPRAVVGFLPPGRTRGLRLVATDLDRTWGRGEEVRGPALLLAAALMGRQPALAAVEGPGVGRLR